MLLASYWVRRRAERRVDDRETHKLVVLGRIAVLAGAEFVDRGKRRHVDVVVHDGIRLLDHDHSCVGAGEAPEHHRTSPECAAVVDLEVEAVLVAPQVLEAVGEEVSSLPVPKPDDIAYVSQVVREVVERGPQIAGQGAKSPGSKSDREGTRELTRDQDRGRLIREEETADVCKGQRRRRLDRRAGGCCGEPAGRRRSALALGVCGAGGAAAVRVVMVHLHYESSLLV